MNRSLPPDIPDDSPPKNKKVTGKGIVKALTKSFKRKQAERSPEVPQPSKKPSVQSFSPSISSLHIPTAETPGPPLTTTPSFVSIHSFESDTGRNFEAERLRLLLNASQEDLRLERSRFAEREQLQTEMFENQRRQYELRIRELENARRGEGSSRRK
jgi:hypothetical protein